MQIYSLKLQEPAATPPAGMGGRTVGSTGGRMVGSTGGRTVGSTGGRMVGSTGGRTVGSTGGRKVGSTTVSFQLNKSQHTITGKIALISYCKNNYKTVIIF